ncbi:uncharacterized protein LOC125225613 [Leguminivora glycinivorella]|uniref:uncharacterized protein LOC125225613 n=1 Tax=Leguminivora glycinivorella TaxID=1035111 RepID=UPI00200F5322|nr:uncharacterized protein LOC125225613 [Leguminivora glycinivorella]
MVKLIAVILVFTVFGIVLSKPLEDTKDVEQKVPRLWKRYINSALASGFYNDGISRIRTRRNVAEDCEKLELCRLHARSSRNFLSAFELYFVNKENARLWDHQTHTIADCDRRFAHCFGSEPQRSQQKQFRDRADYDSYREFSDDY